MLSGAQIALNFRGVCLGDKCTNIYKNKRLRHFVHV